jgi:hypothetical protein
MADTINRSRYQHDYYTRNKHRKKYTYIKKGIMKKVSPVQYAILRKMQRGLVLYKHHECYRYFQNGLYHAVNTASVDCLIRTKHVSVEGFIVKLTDKGSAHVQKDIVKRKK